MDLNQLPKHILETMFIETSQHPIVGNAADNLTWKTGDLIPEEVETLELNLAVYYRTFEALSIAVGMLITWYLVGLVNKYMVQIANVDIFKWLHRFNTN